MNSLQAQICRAYLFLTILFVVGAIGCSRPAQTAPRPAQPPPFEYLDTWGQHGDGPGELGKPVGMASDGESIIYIADAGNGFIHKFAPSGEPRLSFQDDRLNLHPTDIAVDAGAAMYVADGSRGVILIFFSDGMQHREVRPGALAASRDSLRVAVDAFGTVFVAAKHPFGIRKFSPALRLVGSWGSASGKPDTVDNPASIAVGPDGLVYLLESETPQIKVYDPRGAPQRNVSVPAESQDARLTGIAVSAKYIFAVDSIHPTVYVWSLDGAYRMQQDLSPWIPAAAAVRKVVVTPAGELLVLDTAASRVFRFRLHL